LTPGHEEALRALRLADRDIVAFRALLNSPEVSLASTCFFAQQAVEKCLKVVLFERGIAFTPIHDLVRLALTLQEHDIVVPCSADELRKLNPFAVTFRYDDTDIPLISGTEVEKLVDTMRRWADKVVKC
jgi:HEPN domain-containing protein